jgi:hypothetical protein
LPSISWHASAPARRRGLGLANLEKVERRRKTPEAKGMSHGPFLGLDVFEIRQLLQAGVQLNG